MSANKECEMPGTDSCAVMEGENEGDMEDEVVYTKPSLLGKLKAIASKVGVTSTGLPAVANILQSKSPYLLVFQGNRGNFEHMQLSSSHPKALVWS